MPVATETDDEVLPSFEQVDFTQAYRDFTYDYPTYANKTTFRNGFFNFLAKRTSSQSILIREKLGWCGRCTYPELKTELVQTCEPRVKICRTCQPKFVACDECHLPARTGTLQIRGRATNGICQRCWRTNWRYCDTCEDYYAREDRGDHRHTGDVNSCCSSPATQFKVKNNGNGTLRNDRKVNVTLASGEISDEGIAAISQAIVDLGISAPIDERYKWYDVAENLHEIGTQWQARDGNYPKRLSRYAYKKHGLKVPANLVSQVGNIARDHSAAVDFRLAFTRQLNQSARSFGHAESCWWQSYGNSRCAFKTNGGFGIRSYNGSNVAGRAWVMPLKKVNGYFTPTFNTFDPDAFVIFNGYGQMSGYTPARIMSYMYGMTYKKIEFTGNPMYVNGSTGYLVATEESIADFKDGRIALDLNRHSSLFETESRVLANA